MVLIKVKICVIYLVILVVKVSLTFFWLLQEEVMEMEKNQVDVPFDMSCYLAFFITKILFFFVFVL
jgi:hypothetical protein